MIQEKKDKKLPRSKKEGYVEPAVWRLALSYGGITAALLMSYFLLAGIMDFRHIIEFRYFNLLFMAIGVWLALRAFHKPKHQFLTNYLNGFLLGIGTSVVASVLFGLFVLIFVDVLGPELGVAIRNQLDLGQLPVELIALFTTLEGIMSGIMVSFIGMQYFKNVTYIES